MMANWLTRGGYIVATALGYLLPGWAAAPLHAGANLTPAIWPAACAPVASLGFAAVATPAVFRGSLALNRRLAWPDGRRAGGGRRFAGCAIVGGSKCCFR